MNHTNTIISAAELGDPNSSKSSIGLPRQFWLLMISEFFERFAFYGIRWSLVLYMVLQLMSGDPFAQNEANLIYGAYLALFYVVAVFGGYAADEFLGYRHALTIGSILMMCGILMMVIPDQTSFKLGMAITIVGNGLYKPTMAAMMGQLLGKEDGRLFSGFTIFHLVVNLSAFIAPILTQYLSAKVFSLDGAMSFKVVFIFAGIAMLLSSIFAWVGRSMGNKERDFPIKRLSIKTVISLVLGVPASVSLVYFMLTINSSQMQFVQIAVLLAAMVLLAFESMRAGVSHRNRFWMLLILFVINFSFLASSTYVADLIKPISMQLVNSGELRSPSLHFSLLGGALVFLIIFAPMLATLWLYFGKSRFSPSMPRAIALAISFTGLSLAFTWSSLSGLTNSGLSFAAWALIAAYAMQGLGELFLVPIGLAATSVLAPARYLGVAMASWYLVTTLGSKFAGVFAVYWTTSSGLSLAAISDDLERGFYLLTVFGLVLFFISPLLVKLGWRE